MPSARLTPLRRHWYFSVLPTALTENVAASPTITVRAAGLVVILMELSTVTVAVRLVADAETESSSCETTTSYPPSSETPTFSKTSCSEFAPLITTPLSLVPLLNATPSLRHW